MSRRDEREIARGLRETPGGAPPADLLDRLRADLPGELALRDDAAARRRPVALGGRWLLAASLAGMTAAGLLALHTMEPMRERLAGPPSAAAAPEHAAPRGGLAASAPRPEPPPPAAVGGSPVSPAPPAAVPKPGAAPDRVEEPLRHLAALSPPLRGLPQGAGAVRPQAAEEERWGAKGELVAPSARPPAPARGIGETETQAAGRQDLLAESPSAPGALAGGASEPEPRPARPLSADRLEARAKAAAPAGAARESLALRADAADIEEAAAPPAEGPRLWAPEVSELAASYDDDPLGADGWALAAGGTPPPPRVAGLPVHGPPAGALWVRFRVRALDPALAPAGARVEIAWTSGALRDRRLLGGEAGSGEADVFPLSAGALRRGWTAVYEVRPAPAPRASFERLATLRVVTAQGAPLREMALPLSALSRAWMDAPGTLRLPCLAAAFAERRALGAPEGYVDLVAAARSLAVARGRRDARAATLLELIARAERASPASPP